VRGQQFLVVFVGFIKRLDLGGQFFEADLLAFPHAKFLRGDFHGRKLRKFQKQMKAESGLNPD
jgi:hypothetical protein